MLQEFHLGDGDRFFRSVLKVSGGGKIGYVNVNVKLSSCTFLYNESFSILQVNIN